MLNKIVKLFFASAIILTFNQCKTDEPDDPEVKTEKNKNEPTQIDGGKTYLQFNDEADNTWYPTAMTGDATSSTITILATNDDGEKFELEVINNAGNTTIPVVGNSGYLKFTNSNGETFDTHIGGGGKVIVDKWDDERVECRFLFTTVTSLSNNNMAFTDGKFGFNQPIDVDLSFWLPSTDVVEIDRVEMKFSGEVSYKTGPKSGYDIEVSTGTGGILNSSEIDYNGKPDGKFSFVINGKDYTYPISDEKVIVTLKYDGEEIHSITREIDVLPVGGTYKLNAINGAAPNSSTITISLFDNPSNRDKLYKIVGLFPNELIFEEDQDGRAKYFGPPLQYMGGTVTNPRISFNGSKTLFHISLYNGSANFYEAIRQ